MTASAGSIQGFQHHLGNKFDAASVGRHQIAGEDAGDGPVARQGHIDHEIVPRHAGDLQQFAVQRIILDGAFHRARLAHELRAVQNLDSLLRRQAGGHQLPAARKAQHQVRFDEPQGDMQVGGNEAIVDVNRRARRRAAQVAV